MNAKGLKKEEVFNKGSIQGMNTLSLMFLFCFMSVFGLIL